VLTRCVQGPYREINTITNPSGSCGSATLSASASLSFNLSQPHHLSSLKPLLLSSLNYFPFNVSLSLSLPLSLYPKHHTCNASCVTTLRATVDPFSPLGLWAESNTLGSRTRLCWPRRPHWDGLGPKATAVGRWIYAWCRRLTAYLRSSAMIICRLGLRKSFLTAPAPVKAGS
jgi:hypothetical protein